MCRITERYSDGTEEIWEGKKVRENGTTVSLLIPKCGVREIPKRRIIEISEEPRRSSSPPLLT